MKKHPVDDLFRNKLKDLERQPSAMAWTRIAARHQKPERRLGGWIWYAAAGIVVVLLSGYLVWQQQQVPDNGNLAVVTRKAESLKAKAVSHDTLKQTDRPVDEAASDRAIASYEKPSVIVQKPSVFQKGTTTQKVQHSVTKDTDLGTDQPESFHTDEIAVNTIKSDLKPEPVKTNITQPQLALNESKEENRTIVVNVEVPEEDNEKPRQSRFTKVFRQLKNVRAGDPVDWQDVGFNPKIIVARVDETIRDKEESISEKYQNIKQKTKL